MDYFRKYLPSVFIILFGMFSLPQSVFAADIVVDNGTSIFANDGSCSLREAIANANNNNRYYAGVGECIAGDSATTDTIILTTDVVLDRVGNTFQGPNGLTVIATNMKIEGNGHIIERKIGSPGFRILHIQSGTVTLKDLTIRNGYTSSTGGGIRTCGGLNLINTKILNNTAYKGGGILVCSYHQPVTMQYSQISDNTASSDGGGIHATNGIVIQNSIISGKSG